MITAQDLWVCQLIGIKVVYKYIRCIYIYYSGRSCIDLIFKMAYLTRKNGIALIFVGAVLVASCSGAQDATQATSSESSATTAQSSSPAPAVLTPVTCRGSCSSDTGDGHPQGPPRL